MFWIIVLDVLDVQDVLDVISGCLSGCPRMSRMSWIPLRDHWMSRCPDSDECPKKSRKSTEEVLGSPGSPLRMSTMSGCPQWMSMPNPVNPVHDVQ